jgi:hypothetical protein
MSALISQLRATAPRLPWCEVHDIDLAELLMQTTVPDRSLPLLSFPVAHQP